MKKNLDGGEKLTKGNSLSAKKVEIDKTTSEFEKKNELHLDDGEYFVFELGRGLVRITCRRVTVNVIVVIVIIVLALLMWGYKS